MADIKQAAKWMAEGKRVRRADWRELNPHLEIASIPVEWLFSVDQGYGAGRDCIVNCTVPERISFSTMALLADDWEIVEETP